MTEQIKEKKVKKYQQKKKNQDEDDCQDKIEKWQVPAFDPEKDGSGRFLEESSFAVLFPRYRETYIREAWPAVTKGLKKVGIHCELDLIEGTMMVKTTRHTRDPFAIIKARDLIKLLARSVPLAQALKILDDNMQADFILIGGMVANKDRFIKRRQRLIGPNGATLKAIEKLTDCYVLVQGSTVSVMGPWGGLKVVRMIVEDCMNNIHPIYNIKKLMIQRELAKDPELAKQSWDRFLPHFASKSQPKKKKPVIKKKTGKALFPDLPLPSKVDLELESGEYFLKQAQRKAARREALAEEASSAEQSTAESQYEEKKRLRMEQKLQKQRALIAPTESHSSTSGVLNEVQSTDRRSAKQIASSLTQKLSSISSTISSSSSSSSTTSSSTPKRSRKDANIETSKKSKSKRHHK